MSGILPEAHVVNEPHTAVGTYRNACSFEPVEQLAIVKSDPAMILLLIGLITMHWENLDVSCQRI